MCPVNIILLVCNNVMGLSLGFTDLVVNKKSIKIMSTADDSLDNTLSKVPPITNNYPLNTAEIPKFYARRNLKNHSDSIESFCKCESGIILLFYSYQQTNAQQLSHFLLEQCQLLDIFGKLRVSVEGFNCTLGGGDEQIARFIKVLLEHLNLENLTKNQDFIKKFFKPSPGCKHKFDSLSVKIVDRLFPVGSVPKTSTIQDYLQPPETVLTPSQFHHAIATDKDAVVLDIRNYYETRMGNFTNAVCLPIRKYSSVEGYLSTHSSIVKDKNVYVYCTGGVRCESITSVLESTGAKEVRSLQGGIHNYLEWVDESDLESMFKGVNYVFDARGAIGIPKSGVISSCFKCHTPTFKMTKCKCHLVLVWCGCGDEEVRCCSKCENGRCDCEDERRRLLHSTDLDLKPSSSPDTDFYTKHI